MVQITFFILLMATFTGCSKSNIAIMLGTQTENNNSTNNNNNSGGNQDTTITTGIVKVNTGDDHTCILTADHKVYCSGDNGDYQSGADRVYQGYDVLVPIEISTLFAGLTVEDISTEYDANCAVFTNGTAKCWGGNRNGDLGVGHTNDVSTPENLQWFDGSTDAKSIKKLRLGEYTGCVLNKADALYCWGDNQGFAFDSATDPGDPTLPLIPYVTTPVAIADFDGSTPAKTVKDFRVGYRVICAVSMTNEFKCFGRIVDDNSGDTEVPVPFVRFGMDGSTPAKKVVNFSLGYSHGCIITEDQNLQCWGRNGGGKLGCGQDDTALSFSSTLCPVLNPDSSPLQALSVAAGDYQTCAITLDHKAKCWGRGWDGNLGNGQLTDQAFAVTVIKEDGSDLSDLAYINSGVEAGHSCALTTAGQMYCWGDNGDGQLMLGFSNNTPTPKLVSSGLYKSMARGYDNFSSACFVKKDDSVSCADNNNNVLTTLLGTPVDGAGANKAQSITQNSNGGCALLTNGKVNCWDSSFNAAAVAFYDLSDAAHTAEKVAKSGSTSCALASDGSVRCDNDNFAAASLNNIIDISGNDSYLCAIDSTSAVKCYVIGVWTPIPVANLDGSGARAEELSVSQNVGCALTQTNGVFCWAFDIGGENQYGQLGNGTIVTSGMPTFSAGVVNDINGTTLSANTVQAGDSQVCAQMTNRDIYCWGYNGRYSVINTILGSTDRNISSPVKVNNLPTGENFSLNVLGNSSCVIGDTSGDLHCWGDWKNAGLTENYSYRSKAIPISL